MKFLVPGRMKRELQNDPQNVIQRMTLINKWGAKPPHFEALSFLGAPKIMSSCGEQHGADNSMQDTATMAIYIHSTDPLGTFDS